MENTVNILVKKLDEKAVIPTYAHDGDVGMDFVAIGVEYNEENDCYYYHTGLSFESSKNLGQFCFPRSSNRKTDCYLTNSVGIIDTATYRGEVIFCYKSRISTYERANIVGIKAFMKATCEGMPPHQAKMAYENAKQNIYEMTKNLEFAPFKVGDKIGQLVFLSHPTVNFVETIELSETSRGANGFGSTDKK